DVNVLLALFDETHVFHHLAHDWLNTYITIGWASCPLTQNGYLRIVSSPAYSGVISLSDAGSRLRKATSTQKHHFWPDSISLLDRNAVHMDRLLGAKQLTDAYLLALAVHNGGTFATFDRKLDYRIVPNAAPENLTYV